MKRVFAGRRRLALAMMVLATGLVGGTASSRAQPAQGAAASHLTVVEYDCTAVSTLFGPPDHPEPTPDRIKSLIPNEFHDEYDLASDKRLQVIAVKCGTLEIQDSSGKVLSKQSDAIHAAVRVSLGADPEDPNRQVTQAPHFDTYQLWLAANSPDLVQLLKQEGGQGDRAIFVKDLVFNFSEDGGSFNFEAPSPTPWPFNLQGRIDPDPKTGAPFITTHHWGFTERGWFKIGDPDMIMNVRLARAEGTVQAKDPSMANMLCSASATSEDLAGRADYDKGIFTVAIVDKPITRPDNQISDCPETP